MSKHVIFLGAGASRTSGYPLGDDLRKDHMASAEGLKRIITDALDAKRISSPVRSELISKFNAWSKPFDRPLQLFREGCFGTIDEFCKLIKDSKPDDVVKMKKVLRLALGIHDPEEGFTTSDYYGFIQSLFARDIQNLRDDVVVISFNYDVYLEWLLGRACLTRQKALEEKPVLLSPSVRGAVTSGFSGGGPGLKKIIDGSDFCVLKLHGMIAWPETVNGADGPVASDLGFGSIFDPDIVRRLENLLAPRVQNGVPPILFPWEIMDVEGRFISEGAFNLKDPSENGFRHGAREEDGASIYRIFKETWIRAQREVRFADKISFVGISMHEFLRDGFRFLFDAKDGEIELVVTDHGKQTGSGEFRMVNSLLPNSSPFRVLNFLNENCRALTCNSLKQLTNPPVNLTAYPKQNAVKIRKDFQDFIAHEMDPIRR